MQRRPGSWYDAQYDNRARIVEHPSILQEWADRSAAALRQLQAEPDIAYGATPRERLDVYLPRRHGRASAPVWVYLHGGYWRALDKRDQAFIAAPFVDAGALVVLPDYSLAPAVSVEDIVRQVLQALAWVWRHAAQFGGDPDRIVVAGHSAGAHLATMALACLWPQVAPDLPPRLVRSALALSGVFDLEPLRHAPFLAADLRLTRSSARRLSPVHMPGPPGPLLALVGQDESAEFLRQNTLIARAWGRHVVPVCETVPGRHHMSVLATLADPAARVHRLALGLLGLPGGLPAQPEPSRPPIATRASLQSRNA